MLYGSKKNGGLNGRRFVSDIKYGIARSGDPCDHRFNDIVC